MNYFPTREKIIFLPVFISLFYLHLGEAQIYEVITYPWYNIILILVISGLLLTLLIWLGSKLYTYRTRLEKNKLGQLIEARTQEILHQNKILSQKNEEIQAQRDALEKQNQRSRRNEAVLEKALQKLKKSGEEVKQKNKTLQNQNIQITKSLLYARNIQQALLPSEERLSQYFPEHFILIQPKDIVSGDFYWFSQVGHYSFISIVDCTGHGVPGAFMSMIGNTLLNEIVNNKHILAPDQILENLHLGVREGLKQDQSANQDGMDISLCRIFQAPDGQIELVFAGAKQNLYVLQKSGLKILEGDRKSIGGFQPEAYRTYNHQTLILQKNDRLYLSSDGLMDSANEQRKKFGSKRLEHFIIQSCNLPIPQQKKVLMETLKDYSKNADQRDDILIMGIELT